MRRAHRVGKRVLASGRGQSQGRGVMSGTSFCRGKAHHRRPICRCYVPLHRNLHHLHPRQKGGRAKRGAVTDKICWQPGRAVRLGGWSGLFWYPLNFRFDAHDSRGSRQRDERGALRRAQGTCTWEHGKMLLRLSINETSRNCMQRKLCSESRIKCAVHARPVVLG